MYDVIIVGAGPAGISASLYTIRGNLKTLVIYKEKSSLEKAQKIENYYGFENGIKGEELYKTGIEQAKNLGVEILEEEVTNIQIDFIETDKKQSEQIFKVETLNNEFQSKSVILATGNKKNKPNIDRIDEYVAGIGNGDYAISEAMDLQNVAKSIKILTNGKQIPEYRAENVDIINKEIKEVARK